MFGKMRLRSLVLVTVLAIVVSTSVSARAQLFGDQQYQTRRTHPQGGGFFQNFFGRDNWRSDGDGYDPPQQRQKRQPTQETIESSRAPAPRQVDPNFAPTTSIVVMGDDMADWLAYGLENVFSDSPDVGIIRKNKSYSGLLRYDAKSDLDWWHVARDTLAKDKVDYVVMMLGLGDRQEILEKDLVKEAATRAKEQQVKNDAAKKDGQKSPKGDNAEQISTASLESGEKNNATAGFRSDRWAKIYTRRIDETIAALKSKGVPIFWVGLPPIRGARSTADAAFLNDLYRVRAERAGITYIDVWDGFADEAGKYSNFGPDYEGQTRRLRLSDGVFFTKYGAVKLAHYVEREIRRVMNSHIPVALPSEPLEPATPASKPVERPLMGPVISLTGSSKDSKDGSEELLGAPGSNPIHGEAIATKVFVKGETVLAPSGRADNFAWPPANDSRSAKSVPSPSSPTASTKSGADEATNALASAPTEMKQHERKKDRAGQFTHQATKRSARIDDTQHRSQQDDIPRPSLPIGPLNSPFARAR
jgi:uncharacterized protein